MKLTDILPIDKWEQFENEAYNKSGLQVNAFDINGIRITSNKIEVNKLCPEIKATDKGQSFICAVAHMNLAAEAKQAKEPVIEECDAGFVKVVVPIFVNQEFIGTIGACGLLLDDGEVDSFAVNKITEIDEDKIINLSQGIKSITISDVKDLIDYIKVQLDKFVN